MSVLVKSLGFYSHKGGKLARGLAKAKAHLKYLEYGKAHPNRPEGFDGARDGVTRKEFMAYLAAQPERGVIAHKLVLSLSQEERDRLGVDMKELTRETMASYQARSGRELRWIAFLHDDPGQRTFMWWWPGTMATASRWASIQGIWHDCGKWRSGSETGLAAWALPLTWNGWGSRGHPAGGRRWSVTPRAWLFSRRSSGCGT